MQFVILGTLGFYKNMVGQRQNFLANELVKNHEVLFLETHNGGIKEATNKVKIDCFMSGDWLHNSYDVPYMQKKLDNILSAFSKPNKKKVVIFEIPLSGYINCIPIFKKHGYHVHYDCIDNWRYFYGGNMIDTDRTKELIRQCNSISASAKHLITDLKERFGISNISYIPNAYGELDNVEYPMSIDNTKLQIAYYGSLGEWWNPKLVKNIVTKYPNIEFHCFGNYSPREEFTKEQFNDLFKDRSNCHFYGHINRMQLKSMINKMDYCIIPFIDSPLIHSTDAVKAYEITSQYKKILYPYYMYEMIKFPVDIRIPYDNDFHFGTLPKNYKIDKKQIDEFINENTWKVRVKNLMEVFNAI